MLKKSRCCGSLLQPVGFLGHLLQLRSWHRARKEQAQVTSDEVRQLAGIVKVCFRHSLAFVVAQRVQEAVLFQERARRGVDHVHR